MIRDLHILFKRKSSIRINRSLKTFSWSLKEIKLKPSLVNYFECTLTDGSVSIAGYGEDSNPIVAIRKSFSESVERYLLVNFPSLFPDEVAPINSNGFAAGPDLSFSRLNSKLELLERKIISDAWYYETGWKEISFPTKHKCSFSKRGFESKLYQINNDSNYAVLCGIIFHPQLGVYLDSVALAEENVKKTRRLISSLLRGAAVLSTKNSPSVLRTDISERSTPEEIGRYYCGTKLLDFWEYFLGMSSRKETKGINLAHETSKIKTFDITAGNSAIPAVSYSSHPNWRGLSWGRKSMYGKNPWHLPFV